MPRGSGAPGGAARRGLRWHARDMARQADYHMARYGPLGVFGAVWTCLGLVLLAVAACASPAHAWVYLEFGGISLTGTAARLMARHWSRQ